MQVIIVNNDATACFDCMLEASNNLACLQHRAGPKYIQLHAQTQQELMYYLKHKYRIPMAYNSHSDTYPWYGMGQGAGDACNQWVIGSDSMANAYQENAQGWIIPSPLPNETITLKLKAFVDDVNLFIGQKPGMTNDKFHATTQKEINSWHGILKPTGGELNTKKCFSSDYHLQYDPKEILRYVPKHQRISNLL